MPKTDFTCRGKILGGYYADADTQCQMFHICVKVAGVGVQDFRFLCPNGTAFDQEAQTCADFGDVDCEQATLFYGSDNFDLYRIGSGFDSAKRPTPTTEDESTFHLQRAESNDIRRSKQPISVQNSIYGLGSPFNQHQYELSTVKPANQYQSQKVTSTTTTTTSTPRSIIVNRKSTTTVTPYITSKSTTAAPNYNDEIFKGSHSSNFYSNRNNNNDDDDYKRGSVTNHAKGPTRSRGRTQYRGTPATTTSTTFKPPVVQNYTTLTSFASKSTTPSPFKFTFTSTVRTSSALPNSAQLGPLQQQYQQPNYNNNFVNFKIQTSTSVPTSTTQKSNLQSNGFNNLISTPTDFNVPLRQVVSAPTPFNNNHINNVNSKYDGSNANLKLTNNNIAFSNNNIYNNAFNSKLSNVTRQYNGRVFDNHNAINNYQTTSPFASHKTFENHIQANKTILRLAPAQVNQFSSQNTHNTHLAPNNSFYQPNRNLAAVAAVAAVAAATITTTTIHPSTTTKTQTVRNPLVSERPNFNQQDLINQFNIEQRKLTQPNQTNANTQSGRRPDAQNHLSLEQKRLQLHYDINDYLTTDKYSQSQYSPTSEQYRSIQSLSSVTAPRIPQSTQLFTQKYNDVVFSTTPNINRQQYEANSQYQTQHDRPFQSSNLKYTNSNSNSNSNFKFNDRVVHTTSQSTIPKQSINDNSFVSTSTKKFSTLVPKENYAPTTFKPLFYFNVAKQINDNLSTVSKLKTATDASIYSQTSTTSRSVEPIFNRATVVSRSDFRESAPINSQIPALSVPSSSPVSIHLRPSTQEHSGKIDENDGQYHPELYEKDFARYKIKNRKKQQQIGHILPKQNFAKAQNTFGHQPNVNRGSQKTVGTSIEEELLHTAHSQNIAASGNELYNSLKTKQSRVVSPKSSTTPSNTSKKESSPVSKEDKDVSYDYAYYDSGNDTPHDYSEFDLPDFGKTKNK